MKWKWNAFCLELSKQGLQPDILLFTYKIALIWTIWQHFEYNIFGFACHTQSQLYSHSQTSSQCELWDSRVEESFSIVLWWWRQYFFSTWHVLTRGKRRRLKRSPLRCSPIRWSLMLCFAPKWPMWIWYENEFI